MEKCSHCQKIKHPLLIFDYNELLLCNTCFTRLIESRVKKNIKGFGPLEKGDILFLFGDRFSTKIAYYLLSKIFDSRFITIKKIVPNSKNSEKLPASKLQSLSKGEVICYTASLEETAHNIIEGIFKSSVIKPILQNQLRNSRASQKQPFDSSRQIYLFCDIPFEELLLYQKYQRIALDKKIPQEFNQEMKSLIKNSSMFKSLDPSKKELFGLISSFKKLSALKKRIK